MRESTARQPAPRARAASINEPAIPLRNIIPIQVEIAGELAGLGGIGKDPHGGSSKYLRGRPRALEISRSDAREEKSEL